MPEKTYLDSGTLFKNDHKEKETQPDMRGKVEFSKETLRHMVEKANAGEKIEVEIAAWSRTSPRAGKWLSLKFQKPYEKGEPNDRDSNPNQPDIPF
jgi:hypothetical protein